MNITSLVRNVRYLRGCCRRRRGKPDKED